MKKLLRHGRNSKPSSGGGGGDIDEVLTKIKEAFIEAGYPDAYSFGSNDNNEYYPDEPLGINPWCDDPGFYWWNHPSGMEYQNLLIECRFRSGYISDSDFRNHLSCLGFAVDGNADNSNVRIEVGTDGDTQYVFITIPVQVTDETGTDCFAQLYYDDVEIIDVNGSLGTYTAD